MNMEEYTIREVEKKDSKRIWEIRNNPLVRNISGNTEFIAFKDHEKWFNDKYFKNENNYCYILGNKTSLVGYCRLDYNEEKKAYIVSIAINPENHGKGFGIQLLFESLEKLKNIQDCLVLAEVKKDNFASIKLFEKTGFEKYKEEGNNYYYQKKL